MVREPRYGSRIVLVFDTSQYEAACGTGAVPDLPSVDRSDFAAMFAHSSYLDWREALYTVPDLEDDPQGRVAARELFEAIRADSDRVRIATDVEPVVRLRIGLDRPGTPEAVYEIGRWKEGLAVRLSALPHCPVWISGPSLSEWAAKVLAAARPD